MLRGRRAGETSLSSLSLSCASQPATTTMYASSWSMLAAWPSRESVIGDLSGVMSGAASYVGGGERPAWKYLHVKSVPRNVSHITQHVCVVVGPALWAE